MLATAYTRVAKARHKCMAAVYQVKHALPACYSVGQLPLPPPKKKTHFISDHQRSWWNHKKNPAGKQQKYTNKGVQISQWIGSFSRHYGQQWFVAGGHLSIGHIGVLAPVPQRLDSGPSDSLGTKLLREFIEVRNCWVKQPFEKACGSRTLTHFATLTNT